MAQTPESGPLSSLLAGLPEQDVEPGAVHPRVLELPDGEGRSWTVACFEDPGGARALHSTVRRVVEATLLSELSSAPELVHELHSRPPVALRLVSFVEIDEAERAVEAFGFQPLAVNAAVLRKALARFRGEVARRGAEPPEEAAAAFEASIISTPFADELERQILLRTGDEVWGAEPGAPAARLLSVLATQFPDISGSTPAPNTTTLRDLEPRLFTEASGCVRWLPPLLFQALCDLAAVAAVRELGQKVDWAECAPGDDGLCPPPLLRATAAAGAVHIPIGLELLRWCVMPRGEAEQVAPFGDRVVDLFEASA